MNDPSYSKLVNKWKDKKGDLLCLALKKAVTRRELAKTLKVSKQTVDTWYDYEVLPNFENLCRLVQYVEGL